MANPTLTAFPAYGSLAVGGYTFSNFTETDVNIQPEKSLDGRTVSFSTITIGVHAKIVGDVGVAALEIAFAVPRLQKAGVGIVYKGRGLDRLFAALGRNVRDIAWGPMPGTLKIKPLGGYPANAFDVFFTIEAKVPTCTTARFAGPIDLATTITFQVDYAGYLTRSYAVRLRIANNLRPDGRGGTDSPDEYRADVTPAPLPGFYRKFGPWVTSEDKTELRGEIRDEELPGLNVPPEWVVGEPVLSHHVSSVTISGKPSLKQWVARFSGHYEISKDCPDSNIPAIHFFDVFVAGRIDNLLRGIVANPGTAKLGAVIPVAVDFGEPNALGRRLFDFSVTFAYTDDAWTVIGNSGVWKPLEGSSWPQWAASLSLSAFNSYGTAQAVFTTADDNTVTGLCSPLPTRPSAGATNRTLRNTDSFDAEDWIDRVLRTLNPGNSWLEYENTLTVLPSTGSVVLKTLPTVPPKDPAGGAGAMMGNVLGAGLNAAIAGAALAAASINPVGGGVLQAGIAAAKAGAESIQQRTSDSFRVVMEGHALRAGFEIPPPVLTEVGGVKATPLYEKGSDYWTPAIVSNAGGVAIYGAAWRFTYFVEGPLKKAMEPAPNPLLQP